MMSITLFSRYRRQRLRNAWSLASMGEWCRNVGAKLAAFLLILLVVQWIDDQLAAADQMQTAREKAERNAAHMESVFLSCLNDRGVWIDDRLHLCGFTDTHIDKGGFLK